MLSPALAFALAFLGVPLGATPASAASADLVISQVYGGGGNTGAPLNADYVEIFNRGAATVSLAGLSIQYASATGTGHFGATTTQITELPSVSLAAGQYYLVKEAGSTTGASFSADHTDPTPIAMAAAAGKVALVSGQTTLGCNGGSTPCSASAVARIIDLVGYGGANYYEGAGPAPVLSNTASAFRAGNGCVDTDNNSTDFTAGTPAPRDSSLVRPCAGDAAPVVASSTPGSGATGVARDANVTVTFSEPVTVSGAWSTITCATSGAHATTVTGSGASYTIDPTDDFAAGETCTVTVRAAQVTDLDTNDPPDNMAGDATWSFTTDSTDRCGDPATFISKVQGSGTATPMSGAVVTVEGVVVGDYQATGQLSGYYVQEEDGDADGDAATSEGIFVLNTSFPVAAGDRVRITGVAGEASGLTRLSSITRTLICPAGGAVSATTITLPVASMSVFERYEGMLVAFTQTLTATETFGLGRFGEVRLSANGRLYTPTAVTTPGAAALAQADLNQRSSFVLDDGNGQQNIDPTIHPVGGLSASNTLRSGYTTDGLTGVFDFRFGTYRLQPVAPVAFSAANPRTALPPAVGGNTKVASFNVLNYFNGDGQGGGFPTARGANTAFELERQRAKEVSALSAMDADIVGLMEIENDAGPYSALAELVAALNDKMGAGTYAYIDTGVIGTDAIKVALIYKPATVTPLGAHQLMTSAVDPRFVDTLNRPSLAQTFERNGAGARLTVVVSHLKSKGSACAGDPDAGDGQGNCNGTRTRAAAALVDWMATDPTGSGDPRVLFIGDLNAYTFEDPITTFTSAGYANLARDFNGLSAYSYVFNGEAGYLDHALASPALAAQATGAVDWHINADEPVVLDYNTEFKTANQVNTFYDAGPYRSSDHDPVVVGLDLRDTTKPTITGAATTEPNALGWYRTDVTVDFVCADNLAVTSCGPDATLTSDGAGQSVTGTAADAAGNTATATVTGINIDKTAPAVAFGGNSATYDVTQTISITCTATDALSGIATQSCPTVSAPAYTFGIGTHTLTASATDNAGNTTTVSTTFTVTSDAASLCTLTKAFVSNAGVATSLCQKLDAAAAATARGDVAAARGLVDAYINEVNASRGKRISDADADLLIAIAQTL